MSLDSMRAKFTPHALSALRVTTGLLFLQHGAAKYLKFPHVAMFDKVQVFSPVGVAGVLELVGGALIVIGLFTRPVAFVLSGLMAFAYFMAHAPRGFYPILNGGELAVLYCFAFLYLACAGGGPWSADYIARRVS
ncbi:MAG: DoxX family protein [Alphaproteobacteria bacterium]|nr:DoxX family protein [Alphaproteobacteria bacterium]